MRMKFNKSSQLLLVTAASLLAAGLVTACATATTDYVYVVSSKAAGPENYGEIDVFEINEVSGFMRQIPSSPFFSGGRNPVAEAVSSDYLNLYVVNQDDNSIVQFFIGPDGKLYPLNTVNTPGLYPLAVAVNGSNLFVVDTFQPLSNCSIAAPCSGSVSVFPIAPGTDNGNSTTSGGQLGTPIINASNGASYWPLVRPDKPGDVMVPTAINVSQSGSYVYVAAYDSSAVTQNYSGTVNICNLPASSYAGAVGYIFGFSVGSTGALTAIPGSPFAAGLLPCGIASDSSASHVYVTDYIKGDVLGYSVASGALTPLSGNPFPAGNEPVAIAINSNSSYPYAFVANSLDGTVNSYSIDGSGALTPIGAYTTGTQPVAIAIDPSTNHFVFTANFLGNNISNFEMSTTAGTLVNAQDSPYTANDQPTAVAAVPHHATQ